MLLATLETKIQNSELPTDTVFKFAGGPMAQYVNVNTGHLKLVYPDGCEEITTSCKLYEFFGYTLRVSLVQREKAVGE